LPKSLALAAKGTEAAVIVSELMAETVRIRIRIRRTETFGKTLIREKREEERRTSEREREREKEIEWISETPLLHSACSQSDIKRPTSYI
jgi:hypothetical protein